MVVHNVLHVAHIFLFLYRYSRDGFDECEWFNSLLESAATSNMSWLKVFYPYESRRKRRLIVRRERKVLSFSYFRGFTGIEPMTS